VVTNLIGARVPTNVGHREREPQTLFQVSIDEGALEKKEDGRIRGSRRERTLLIIDLAEPGKGRSGGSDCYGRRRTLRWKYKEIWEKRTSSS